MQRTFPHFQAGLAPWARRFYEAIRARDPGGSHWGKLMDPGEAEPLPECPWLRWVVRFYEDEPVAKAEVLQGAAGAEARYQRWEPHLRRRPWLVKERYFLETMNEPSNAGLLETAERRRLLAEHTAHYVRILWDRLRIRSCAYCLGVGHPEPGHAAALLGPGLESCADCGGVWSLHEYGWPVMDSGGGWWTLRYRRTVAALQAAGVAEIPPLLITECGIDGRLIGRNEGWQKVNNDPSWYAGQLEWYDAQIAQDDYVAGALVFTAMPHEPWQSEGYEVTEALAERLAVRWQAADPPPKPWEGNMKIFDEFSTPGQVIERDRAWLEAHFGSAVKVQASVAPAGKNVFRVAELRAREGPATVIVQVKDGSGGPMADVPVIRYWPSAPSLPAWEPPPERYRDRGVVGRTSATDGDVGFGMGTGDYYNPATQSGASAIWLGKPGHYSDLVSGLGMISGTNHRHLDVVFALSTGDEPVPPAPSEGDLARIATAAEGMEKVLRKIYQVLSKEFG